jgi:nicotinate-nucleotide adenylyltransferase
MSGRQQQRRIALYGGTFDPVHTGHLAVADGLLQLFSLNEVVFIPAYIAPHKREREVTRALHRYAMLALATQSDARFRVSTIELDAPARPYTFETLSLVQERLGREAEIFFVMGADSWMDITTWREWEKVLALSNHIVVARPGYELSAEHVTPAVREKIVDLRGREKEQAEQLIQSGDPVKVYVTDAVNMDVSATAIRQAVREGRDAEWLKQVPPQVADYIRKYGLYREA